MVHLVPGSMWLDASCGAASGESSLFRADLFSGKILKVSFSTVSYLVFLASTQSSKVLKEIDLLSVSSMVLKESLLVPFLMVHYKTLRSLKRVRATDLRLHVLEGNIFPPYLTNGPERSLSTSHCVDLVIDPVITLVLSGKVISDGSYAMYTHGLERSQLVFVLLLLAY